MVDERITTRDDGVVTEQVVERDTGDRVYVEKSGGGGFLVGLLILVAIAIGAWFLLAQNDRENAETDAVVGAADQVGDSVSQAAEDVGDAAENAAN